MDQKYDDALVSMDDLVFQEARVYVVLHVDTRMCRALMISMFSTFISGKTLHPGDEMVTRAVFASA